MHQYLRSVGFSKYTKNREIDELLSFFEEQFMNLSRGVVLENGDLLVEIRAQVAKNMGINIVGIRDEGSFHRLYYYPYIFSEDVSSDVPMLVFRHVDGEQYSGLIDDARIGVTLIFRLDSFMEFLELKRAKLVTEETQMEKVMTRLAAFCIDGKVLLPALKTVSDPVESLISGQDRHSLIEAARGGDESAIEQLTMNDMNTYANVTKRLQNEDIYSIVDTCFMPQGVECDVYAVVGDIVAVETTKNLITGEDLYDLTIEADEMRFHVGINALDLQGEPAVGRRFKGRIWMMGRIH